MTTLTFDTLKFAIRLKDADVPEKQAEAQADALREVINDTLAEQARVQAAASARSINELDTKTETAISGLKTELKAEILKVDAKVDLLRKDMEALANTLVIRLVKAMLAVMGVGIGLIAAIVRFMPTS